VARRLGVDDGRPGGPTRLGVPPTLSWHSPGRGRALAARAVPQLLINGDACANGRRLAPCWNQHPHRPWSARRGEHARVRGSCGEEDGARGGKSSGGRGRRCSRTAVELDDAHIWACWSRRERMSPRWSCVHSGSAGGCNARRRSGSAPSSASLTAGEKDCGSCAAFAPNANAETAQAKAVVWMRPCTE
jgi:hypothetical protein